MNTLKHLKSYVSLNFKIMIVAFIFLDCSCWCCFCFNHYHFFFYIYSCQGGISMYDHIHIQREKTSLISKIQFIRQVSYGMGYLHSRDIVHKRLTTRNIFLCPNVRISVVDYGLAEVKYDRCVSRLPNRNFSGRLGKAREVAIRPEE